MISFKNSCPKCRHVDCTRSTRRNALERMLGIIILPWRCRDCNHRFFRVRGIRINAPANAKSAPAVNALQR